MSYGGCFFFFQAEDGIRDLVRSRGLGDVYKRQHGRMPLQRAAERPELRQQLAAEVTALREHAVVKPVSYTHLTLPTSDLV